MQVHQTPGRWSGQSALPACASEAKEVGPDDLFKPTPPAAPVAPEEPSSPGWGQAISFGAGGLLAGGASGFYTAASLGGVWGGIAGGLLTLLPALGLSVFTAIPLSESEMPGLVRIGLPLGVLAGGLALGAYWGGTGDLGGPIGLAVAGGVTGAVLIGGLGSFLADRSYENKLDAYYLQMDGFRGAEQRYQSDKREYDRELKAWAQRKEEKHPASVLEDADRLLVNGVQLKKKSPQKPPPPSQGPTLQRPG